MAIRTKPAKNT